MQRASLGRFGQLERQQLRPDLVDDFSYLPAQRLGEVDLKAAARSPVPHIPMWYLNLEHFPRDRAPVRTVADPRPLRAVRRPCIRRDEPHRP